MRKRQVAGAGPRTWKVRDVGGLFRGEVQKINITASQVQGGSFTTERLITGIRVGSFTLATTIVPMYAK